MCVTLSNMCLYNVYANNVQIYLHVGFEVLVYANLVSLTVFHEEALALP